MTLSAVIFDFDGVILDTEPHVYASWRQQYAAHGLDLPMADWVDVIGRPSNYRDFHAELEQRTGRTFDRDALRAERVKFIEAQLRSVPAMPGVTDYLRNAKARHLKLAVASGSSHHWVDNHLQQLGIYDRFDAIVCRDDTDTHKPDPGPYLEAARQLGVSPRDCVAIEDSVHGVRSARAAGMFALAVPTSMTHGEDFAEASHTVASLVELPLAELIHCFDRCMKD